MNKQEKKHHNYGSFRDPSGFIFNQDGLIYRQVNYVYKENYDLLLSTGLYNDLLNLGMIVSHQEVNVKIPNPELFYKMIKPEQIPFISYPYEWSFSQLKDAALLTLEIQKKALEYGMSLKDCSAYNIQFKEGNPVLIDTLSFEKYVEGSPWVAYRQFCQHFISPLALMSYKDIRLNQLLKIHIDGIPLDMTSKILPLYTWLNFSLLIHVHLHAKSQKRYAGRAVEIEKIYMKKNSLLALIDSLESCIKKMKFQMITTEWGGYYTDTNYSEQSFSHKKQIVLDFIKNSEPNTIWDLGANNGEFSRIADNKKSLVVSMDYDPT